MPTVPPVSTIDSSILSPRPSYNYAPTTPEPIPDVSSIATEPPAPKAPAEPQKPVNYASEIQNLYKSTFGKEAAVDDAVNTATADLETELADVYGQINMHKASSLKRQEEVASMGGDARFQDGERQRIARTDAIEAMALDARADALQGRIDSATKKATRAVNARFAQAERDLFQAAQNIQNNFDTLSPQEQKIALRTLEEIKMGTALVQEKKALQKELYATMIDAAKAGAPNTVLTQIENARSQEEAIRIAAPYLEKAAAKSTSTTKGTVQERQADAISQYETAFNSGKTMSDGTPIVDANGFITPKAWKSAIADVSSVGLTRKAFIEAFGHLLFSEKGKISDSYGLTAQEIKTITGSLE